MDTTALILPASVNSFMSPEALSPVETGSRQGAFFPRPVEVVECVGF